MDDGAVAADTAVEDAVPAAVLVEARATGVAFGGTTSPTGEGRASLLAAQATAAAMAREMSALMEA